MLIAEDLLLLVLDDTRGTLTSSWVQQALGGAILTELVMTGSARVMPTSGHGLLHGDYRSLFRGFGVDLADLREYQFHDDIRHIDWNVTARLQTPYVRVYNEDRDVTAWFLLDLSPSVSFGSERVEKRSVAIEFVTVLARLLSRHGNPVGALFYGDRVDTVIPARGGRRHVLHILGRMLSRPERLRSAQTNLEDLLQTGRQVIPRRSLVFVVSDFISTPGWEGAMALLARRHEIVAVRL